MRCPLGATCHPATPPRAGARHVAPRPTLQTMGDAVVSAAVVSAPGKVLLAGGYLILERPHTGTVLALDARFYSSVSLRIGDEPALRRAVLDIDVCSPQFDDHRRYRYDAARATLEPVPLDGRAAPRPNRYVELPLLYTLQLVRSLRGEGFIEELLRRRGAHGGAPTLEVTLAAENGFYSQVAELRARGLPLSADALASLPPMLPPTRDAAGEVAKTGLGSSATLVTSLVAALLQCLGEIELPAAEGAPAAAAPTAGCSLETLHALAQLSHCAAQGKVGSGFDVCVATHGSQRYCRFTPALLAEALRAADGAAPADDVLRRCVPTPGGHVAAEWDHSVAPFQLPPGVEVMMADVCAGAHTPSMVKKVQLWRKEHAAAAKVWAEYSDASARLQAALLGLCAVHAKAAATDEERLWSAPLVRLGALDPARWTDRNLKPGDRELADALVAVHGGCSRLRAQLRRVSQLAQARISANLSARTRRRRCRRILRRYRSSRPSRRRCSTRRARSAAC